MNPKFSEENRKVVQNDVGGPVEAAHAQRIIAALASEEFHRLVDERLRAELQIGFDEADAGEVAEWDVDEILREAHLRHSLRATS